MVWQYEPDYPDDPIPDLEECFVGVDGGATRSRVIVLDPEGREISRVEGPEAQVIQDRIDPVVDVIRRGVRAALARRGIPLPATVLCAGLAGAGRASLREEVRRRLGAQGLARRVRLTTDVEVAFYDAFGDGPGVLLLSGTGSVAWAADGSGHRIRVGGWGTPLGDEGSGYGVALEGLRAALHAHDGRGEETRLTERLLGHLELTRSEELVEWVHYASKAELAALAPLVLSTAAAGDPVARSVRDRALDALTAHVEAALRRVGELPEEEGAPTRVALGGGLLRPGGDFRHAVEERVRATGAHLVEEEVVPARGAARMALELARASDEAPSGEADPA